MSYRNFFKVPDKTQKIKIKKDEIIIGQALTWPIFGADGELLLDKGCNVTNEKQKDILITRGVYRNPTKEEIAMAKKKQHFSLESPFNILDAIRFNLKRILTDMTTGVEDDYNHRVIRLASVIQKLSYENADAALGAIILDQNAPYTNVHPVMCSILTELMTRRLKLPTEDRLLYIAAALTQNIGMLELQNQLSNQSDKLTEQQRNFIKQHPYQSKEILQGMGIEQKEWLNTVLYHHERPDGLGYPNGLKDNEIPQFAKLLSITDIYSAMILPRKYRDGIYIKKALQDIFIQRGQSVDEKSAQLLIKEIGIYPPGTFVKLANGDTAIVLRRGTKNANSPLVLSVAGPRGAYYERPKQRDSIHKDIYGIKEVVPRLPDLTLNRDEIWGINSLS